MVDNLKPKLMLVCDNNTTQVTFRFLLDDNSYDTNVADLDTLFASFEATRPRTIDLLVVELNGREEHDCGLLAWLRRTALLPPLLVLMQGTDRALRRQVFALGACDVIGLPAVPHELQARLRGVLNQIVHGGA